MISFCKIFYVSFIEFLVLFYFLYRYFIGSDPNVVTGGELSEEDQANFIKEMEALFLDAKEEAKKFTSKKYL